MLGNYFAAAIRNLLRNRAYTLINLFGLSLGFTAAILIALYARDELSYDRFIPDHDRTYLVGVLIQPPGRSLIRLSVSSSVDAKAMQLAFPEVELATRLAPASLRLYGKNDSEGMTLASYWADPNFFALFPVRTVAGNLGDALSQPDGVVLTRKAARQLLGREDVIGETIRLGGQKSAMRVAAVIEDWPSNSHLNCEVFLPGIASFSALTIRDIEQNKPEALRSENSYTYIRLRDGASIEAVQARLRAFTDSHIPGVINGMPIAKAYTFVLTPIADLHFQPRSVGSIKPAANIRVLHALIGVALLILAVACGNFISMMTARAARRAIEVGVRKAVGATRRQIVIQFLGECLFYAALALLPAIVAVHLLLPAFNGFLQRDIVFDYQTNPMLALGIVGCAALAGVAAGAYPALYLSRFKPSAVLRGTTLLAQSSRLRQALVVFQFAILIALLVATFTVQRQTRYAIEERLRLPTEQIYLGAGGCPPAMLDAVTTLDGVKAASCVSSATLGSDYFTAIFTPSQGRNLVAAAASPIDYAFFDVFDIKPLAGRLLSTKYGQDDLLRRDASTLENPSIVINESAARALGYISPTDAIGKFHPWKRLRLVEGQPQQLEAASSEIVGVITDFSIGSVRDAIPPTAYYVDPSRFYHLVLRFKGGALPQALESVRSLWTRQPSAGRFDGIFLDQFVNDLYVDVTTQSAIFSLFSSVAVVLAALGLLGLAIFTAERRTKEIGLRKVMGARRRDILMFLGWQFTRPVLWANLIAWPCVYLVMQRWLEGFAYHTNIGLLTFVAAGALALVIALATVASHALLVARAKPVEALRYE